MTLRDVFRSARASFSPREVSRYDVRTLNGELAATIRTSTGPLGGAKKSVTFEDGHQLRGENLYGPVVVTHGSALGGVIHRLSRAFVGTSQLDLHPDSAEVRSTGQVVAALRGVDEVRVQGHNGVRMEGVIMREGMTPERARRTMGRVFERPIR